MKETALATRIRITEKMLSLPVIDFFPDDSGRKAEQSLRANFHLKEVTIKNILSREEAKNLQKSGVIEMVLEELEARFIREINNRKPQVK